MSDDNIDPTLDPLGLGVNLREVNTDRPVLKEDIYLWEIKELSIVPKKDDESKRNLLCILKLDQEGVSTEGDVIHPGYQQRRYMPLQQSETEGAPDFKRDLTLFLCAAFGLDPKKDKESIPPTYPPLSDFIGRKVKAAVKVTDDDTGKQNDIKYITRVD